MGSESELSVPEFRHWLRKCCEDGRERGLDNRAIVLVMLEEIMSRISTVAVKDFKESSG